MGFGDKLKELRDQAQQAVTENRDKIQGAVQNLGEAVNDRTEGRYADTISKAGQRVSEAVDKIAGADAEGPAGAGSGGAATGPSDGGVGGDPVTSAGDPPASGAPAEPSSAPPEFE